MNFFSFFRRGKKVQGSRESVNPNTFPVGKKPSRRSRYSSDDDVQLPEKKRARRRLIGSVVLVLAALIVLPLVFESKPQQTNQNLIVEVNSRVPSTPAPIQEEKPTSSVLEQPVLQSPDVEAPVQTSPSAQASPVESESTPVAKPISPVDKPREHIEKSDRESNAKVKEKNNRAVISKEMPKEKATHSAEERITKNRVERERITKDKAVKVKERIVKAKDSAPKKKAVSGDPIGRMIAEKTKKR